LTGGVASYLKASVAGVLVLPATSVQVAVSMAPVVSGAEYV